MSNKVQTKRYNSWVFIGLAIISLSGCSSDEISDAYGQFEADEITVSAKSSGELLSFAAGEGVKLEAGRQVAQIDTTNLTLQKEEFQAQLEATESRLDNMDAEVAVQKEQLQTAQKNLNRTQSLVNEGAATEQQLDDAEGRVRALQRQIEALQTQKRSVRSEINATRSRLKQVEQQLSDTRIVNPVTGTVLNRYVEPHELVSRGQPLYQIAKLDTLELRVYISGAQLPSVKLGQAVNVLVDKNAEENRRFNGRISWIASEAEFTPRMIQTKEERVTQVYAVKIRVPNPDGILKIGMPGEVNF